MTTLLAVLATLLSAQIFVKGEKQTRIAALLNAKSIAGGLVAFKVDRGSYPCRATRETLENEGIKTLPTGTSSNAWLAQLIATGIIDTEKCFLTPGIEVFQPGDDVMDSSDTLLATGENGFAYVMARNGEPLTDVSALTPIVLASVKVPGIVPIFDKKCFGNFMVYGGVDGAGKLADLNKHGNAMSKGRVHFFETGENSLFGDDFPIVTFPKVARKK